MKPPHPVVERYLAHLDRAVAGLERTERHAIVDEIRNHIAEATAAGRPLDAVLQSLGPANALGRAYAVELLLDPAPDSPRSAAQRWFGLIGLIVALSIPTLVVVTTLGSIAISFVPAGLYAIAAALLEGVGILPGLELSDVPPLVALWLGPVMVVVGLLALAGLRSYVRFVARSVRAVLAPIRSGRYPAREVPAGTIA
jgi:uncharacterized membrane protein